jgi:hypothetical protein
MTTKIFGLAELPIGTIADTVQVNSNGRVPEPVVVSRTQLDEKQRPIYKNRELPADMYQGSKKSNFVIKLRNGFGKLMSHFSKAKPKVR